MTSNAMGLARQTHLSSLYEPRSYRPGKFTNIGAGKTRRETILELKGPGVLKRLWTTHANAEHVRVHIYIDDQDEPVLSGLATNSPKLRRESAARRSRWEGTTTTAAPISISPSRSASRSR